MVRNVFARIHVEPDGPSLCHTFFMAPGRLKRRRPFRVVAMAPVLLVAIATAAAAQIDPRTALLEKAGFEALQQGQAHQAADAFREALRADPKNARLHLGAGLAAYYEHRDEDAKAALERALALDPKLDVARTVLGQVLHRLGDVQGAIRAYETLKPDASSEAAIAAALARWRRELDLHDRMRQSINLHFTVSFEGPGDADLAARALDALERAYWRIGQILGTYPSQPITVVLYTMEQFRDITRAPAWAAGSYDGSIRVPTRGALERSAELDRVLTHEFAHALVHELATRGVPSWLNEGFAAAVEVDSMDWAREKLQRSGLQASLAGLEASFGRLSGRDAEAAYASSAIAVGRLIDEAGGLALANLFRDLGDGVDFETAFAHRIQRPFADFASTLDRAP